MEIVLIAAVAANGVIGDAGEIPWDYPADLQRFKRLTTGHPVILGRRTHEEILDDLGRPLPDRTSIVLTTSGVPNHDSVIQVEGIDAAVEAAAKTESDTAFVAGGERVYRQFLDRADRMEVTEIHDAVEGDTYFPDWDRSNWEERDREDHGEFSFVTYVRSQP